MGQTFPIKYGGEQCFFMAFLHQICWSSLTAKLIQEKLWRCHPMNLAPRAMNFFCQATKFCWPMGKLLKSRPNVLEEPFTNIAFQYFLQVPDRSIHELLLVCLSAMLFHDGTNFFSLKFILGPFFSFYSLHWCLKGLLLLPVDEMYWWNW